MDGIITNRQEQKMKIMLVIAALGCILCGWCDMIITYTPNGRFGIADLKDNEKLAARFEGMPTSRHINSMLWGLLALAMQVCGYFALADNFRESSPACAMIMAIGAVIYISFGAAHHIICGLIEWFYIKFDRTEKARTIVLDFFKKTSVTMIACYLGLVMISAAMFIAIITVSTTLPAWACIFNTAIFYIALAPFKVPAAGNIAGAIAFIGLAVMI